MREPSCHVHGVLTCPNLSQQSPWREETRPLGDGNEFSLKQGSGSRRFKSSLSSPPNLGCTVMAPGGRSGGSKPLGISQVFSEHLPDLETVLSLPLLGTRE